MTVQMKHHYKLLEQEGITDVVFSQVRDTEFTLWKADQDNDGIYKTVYLVCDNGKIERYRMGARVSVETVKEKDSVTNREKVLAERYRKELTVTGVVCNHSPEWLHDDFMDAVNLDYEEHCAECDSEYHDDCWCDVGNETLLVGFKIVEPGALAWFQLSNNVCYGIDYDAEYSAIVGEIYTQIVHSTHAQHCHKCSPCYPGQGDLDTPGDYYLAYTLPPDVWGDSVPVLYRLAKETS